MIDERRTHRRVNFPLECEWALFNGSFAHTRLSDLSLGGCFVETRVGPQLGDTTEVAVTLLDTPTTLRGTVVSVQPGIGFALRFSDLDQRAAELLRRFLELSSTST